MHSLIHVSALVLLSVFSIYKLLRVFLELHIKTLSVISGVTLNMLMLQHYPVNEIPEGACFVDRHVDSNTLMHNECP